MLDAPFSVESIVVSTVSFCTKSYRLVSLSRWCTLCSLNGPLVGTEKKIEFLKENGLWVMKFCSWSLVSMLSTSGESPFGEGLNSSSDFLTIRCAPIPLLGESGALQSPCWESYRQWHRLRRSSRRRGPVGGLGPVAWVIRRRRMNRSRIG